MNLIDSITIDENKGVICLYMGDLADIPQSERVDILVVSAYPDSYFPTRTSLVGALHRKGISVEELSQRKQVDLLAFAKCWLSHPIRSGTGFGRILCYEPPIQSDAARHICGIFQSVIPIACGDSSISTIALPLVATGHMQQNPLFILREIIEQATYWLRSGLTLKTIKIVIYDQSDREEINDLTREFAKVKRLINPTIEQRIADPKWDLFLSYSGIDENVARQLRKEIVDRKSNVKAFEYKNTDSRHIALGANWKYEIDKAIADSRKFVCLLSPHYFNSPNCMDELNIGYMCSKVKPPNFFIPCYLGQVQLPGYLKAIQYIDLSTANTETISKAAESIVSILG